MRFEQTRTVLQKLAPDYHRTVSHYYQIMADGDVSPRVRLLLEYLIDHELRRALALKEFCEEASPCVLDHWFKGIELNFPIVEASLLREAARTDLDPLIDAAITYKNNLIDYFGHLIDHCSDKQTRQLFQGLKNQEEKALKRMIRHAQGLADL